jgi:hypothetical protein
VALFQAARPGRCKGWPHNRAYGKITPLWSEEAALINRFDYQAN